MNLIQIFSAVVISILFIGCSNPSLKQPTNIEGISLELATYRKAVVSSLRYEISMDIPEDTAKSIDAEAKITFNLANNKNPLSLDFAETKEKLHSLIINGKESPIDFQKEHILLPGKSLKAGTNEVVLHFVAGNGPLNRNDDFMYTLLVPDRMRTFMPCFDQPDLKAAFRISATVPKHWEFVSNAKISESQFSDSTKVCTSELSDLFSTYLFSFVAGEFKKSTRRIGTRDVNFYYRETAAAKLKYSMDSVFRLHDSAIRFMEEYTGIPYPFKKLDFIAIPDFQYGGMEHVGAIDYDAGQLFLDESASLQQRMGRAHLIAHETAHMWFGNLVTMKWFNDVWMKEVFADFMADKFVNSIYANTNFDETFLLANHPKAYNIDRTPGANPIRQNLENLNLAGTLYGPIIYNKAPIAMRQLELLIGPGNMQMGLQDYLRTYGFKNADWDQLISILDKRSDVDLKNWNEQWINQRGRPIIDFAMENTGGLIGNFTITQKAEHTQKRLNQKFRVSFFYADSIRTISVDLSDTSQVVDDAVGLPYPLFVLMNSNGIGYGLFRVDSSMTPNMSRLTQPAMRASAWLNIYENVVDGNTMSPAQFLELLANSFSDEKDALILSRQIRQFQNIYWQFITERQRMQKAGFWEDKIFSALESTDDDEKAKTLFQLYAAIAVTKGGVDRVYQVWKSKTPPAKFTLVEDDYMELAAQLVVRNHVNSEAILKEQLAGTTDKDRRNKFNFVLPALSNREQDRDAFFKLITKPENRKVEPWVSLGLGYLHHPLRASSSTKYLMEELRLLEEIRSTGDIFFPSSWLQNGIGMYQSIEAKQIVIDFLRENPGLSTNLKAKVVQETDDLFRAVNIVDDVNGSARTTKSPEEF